MQAHLENKALINFLLIDFFVQFKFQKGPIYSSPWAV